MSAFEGPAIYPTHWRVKLITLLHDLAVRVGIASDEFNYGENIAVWFEDGKKILDCVLAGNAVMALSFSGVPSVHRSKGRIAGYGRGPWRIEHPRGWRPDQ